MLPVVVKPSAILRDDVFDKLAVHPLSLGLVKLIQEVSEGHRELAFRAQCGAFLAVFKDFSPLCFIAEEVLDELIGCAETLDARIEVAQILRISETNVSVHALA